ncbi:MAG: DUF4189 domain-containing protein [Bradyrhizobium sp.]|nr:DUF4189 domain-containing protein [Bradyrhizobium sp.]
MIVSTTRAQRRALLILALTLLLAVSRFITESWAAGAFAVGKCGAHGYAVKPKISSSLNAATRKCHEFGGKECVIRDWACDASG